MGRIWKLKKGNYAKSEIMGNIIKRGKTELGSVWEKAGFARNV